MPYTSRMIHTSPVTIRCPLLIGRDDLLELADRRLDDVLAGRGQFLLIAGVAGIGKTRLLDAIQRKSEGRGLPIATGALAPQDQDVPAASILDLARTMARTVPFTGLGRALLDLVDATHELEHARRRRLVMDTVDLILTALPGPTMLSLEDLQWADDLSLEIIAELARQSRDRPLLLTGDYRIEDVSPGTSLRDWRGRLITQRIAEEVRLAPLTRSETALVTSLILNTGLPASREVAAAVFERTDGIPLHIEELLGALSDDARADGAVIREAVVPDTIEGAVLARLALRSPQAQATARAGAVIGRCFVPEVLAGIMDLPLEALDGPLQELVDHFVLDPPGLRGLYDFRHQLLRDALYRTIPAAERRRYHARAGEFGARLEGASEIHASVHYERAGLRRKAFDAAVIGALDAVRMSAHREAFELYRRAVDNMPDDLDPGGRASILDAYAGEALAIEENDVAERAAHDAAALYRTSGRAVPAIMARDLELNVWRRAGRPLSERITALRELMAELDGLPDDDPDVLAARAGIAFSLGVTLLDARCLAEGKALLATVSAIGLQIEDPEWPLAAQWKNAAADVVAGDVQAGLDRIGAVARAAERAGWEGVGVSAFRDASTIAATVLDYRAAATWIGEGLRYADSIEQSFCAHMMSATSAMVSWAGADLVDAQLQGQQAVADKGCRRGAATARWALGYVSLARGDLPAATNELDVALQFGTTSEEIEFIMPPLWGMAEVALQDGDPDRAFALCRNAFERAASLGERSLLTPFVVTGVRAAQQAGRPMEAAAWLQACVSHLALIPGVAGAALDHGRGLVALAEGATGVARQALESAVAGWDGHGRTWEATWARLDLANCLTRVNRFAEAVALATEAREVASRLDSRVLADRADALLRMARGHVATDEPWRPLTAREFAVARLISEGLTNGEIATELGIASKTASSHVEHILAKLGVSRRAEIATWATTVHQSAASR